MKDSQDLRPGKPRRGDPGYERAVREWLKATAPSSQDWFGKDGWSRFNRREDELRTTADVRRAIGFVAHQVYQGVAPPQ